MNVIHALAVLALTLLPGAAAALCQRPDGTYTNKCTDRDRAAPGVNIGVTDGPNRDSAEFHARIEPIINKLAEAEAAGQVNAAQIRASKLSSHGSPHVSFSPVYPSALDLTHIDWDLEIWAPKVYEQCYVELAFLNKDGQKLAAGTEVVYIKASQDGFATVRGQETIKSSTQFEIDKSSTSVTCY